MVQYNDAEAFIEVLNANQVETIFINPGGETAPIQAAIAKYRVSGKPAPRLVLCLHESIALTAAQGHYMVSGRLQVVMVHAELGTQQIGGAMHNVQWGRVPVVLMAGYFPADKRVNWKLEPFDQAMMVRNCVKWDHNITRDENFPMGLQKAIQIACTEPRGPVYLTYARELVYGKSERAISQPISESPAPSPFPAEELEKAAEALILAKNPLIVTGYSGRYPQNVEALVQLAETLCAPVLTSQVWMNFPTSHPLCAGIEQILGATRPNPGIAEADVILVIDYDLPYALAEGLPRAEAKIIQMDVDPLTVGRVLWGRGADRFIQIDSREAIPALNKIISQKLTIEKKAILNNRFKQLEAKHRLQRIDRQTSASRQATLKPISPDWLCYCLAQIIDEDTILVNHTISHITSVVEQIQRTKPKTLLSCPGGSISWAMGAALGAKVAAPEKTVVSLMTDGGFFWGSPVAALLTARSYHAPFLAVIFDNQAYGFMRGLVEKLNGEGKITDEMAFEAGVSIVPTPDYAMIAQGCGAYGRNVEDPDDVLPALQEALAQVRGGKAAVVAVRLGIVISPGHPRDRQGYKVNGAV